jgi:hypothetical protein
MGELAACLAADCSRLNTMTDGATLVGPSVKVFARKEGQRAGSLTRIKWKTFAISH